jgi:hypothetical protein
VTSHSVISINGTTSNFSIIRTSGQGVIETIVVEDFFNWSGRNFFEFGDGTTDIPDSTDPGNHWVASGPH